MSKVIDERVVEMRFNNKDFESNVQTSLKTIDKLKESLNFDESTKSVEKFQDSLKHFSLDDIGQAVESLSDKFNWGNIFKMDLLNNVVESIYSTITGVFNRIKGELHLEDVDPVSNMLLGWQKYADKTQAVATIMAATGESMEYVNEQMNKLLYFSDETSYSFTDMSDNIGKFTASGVELEDASRAMQGIATWAARSGQNAQTATRVMYNLAQAISMGSLQIRDWNSVEIANMGTKEFREMAIAAGLVTGTLEKNAQGMAVIADGTKDTAKETVVTFQNFRDTLKDGWLDTDTLIYTLNEYGKASELISDINKESGLYASEIIEVAKNNKVASMSTKELEEAIKEVDENFDATNVDMEALRDMLSQLGSEEYEFSLATYEAAQEARTFGDAMASVADAVSSRWMTTFELLFGGYETAKVLWTDLAVNLAEIFGKAGDERNAIFEEANLSGWDKFTAKLEEADLHMLDIEASVRRIVGADELQKIINDAGSFEEALKNGAISADILNQAIDNLPSTFTRIREVSDGVVDNYEEMTAWSWELRKGMYDYVGHDDQVQKLMQAKNISKEYAEQVVTLSERHHELGRELTKEEAAEWLTYTELTKRLEETVELTDEEKEALKALTEELDKKGAQESFVNGLMNIGAIALETFTQVRQGIQNMFPPITAAKLRELAAGFERITGRVRTFLEESKTLENIITALVFPFRVLADVIGAVFKLLAPLGSLLLAIAAPIVGLVAKFGEWLNATRELTGQLNPFADVIDKVAEALSVVLGFAAEVAKYIGNVVKERLVEKFSEPFQKLVETINKFKDSKLKGLDEFINSIKNADAAEAAEKIIAKFDELKAKASSVLGPVASVFKTIKEHFEYLERSKPYSGMTTLQNVFETVRWIGVNAFRQIQEKLKELGFDADKLSAHFQPIADFFTNLKDRILAFAQPILDVFKLIKDHFDYLERTKQFSGFTTLQNVFETIKWTGVAAFKAIRNSLKELGIDIDPIKEKFNSIINTIKEFFSSLKTNVNGENVFTRIKNYISEGTESLGEFMQSLGITLPKVLAGSGIVVAGAGIIGFIKKLKEAKSNAGESPLEKVIDALNPFSDAIEKVKAATASFNITSFAIGVGLLAASLIALSYVPAEKLVGSLGVIGTSLAGFIATIAAVNKVMGDKGTFRMVGMGLGMIAIAGSLLMFAKAIEAFKDIEFESAGQFQNTMDILIMAVISMGRLAKVAGKSGFKLSNGLALIATAGSLWAFGKVLETYNTLKLDKENMGKVLGGLLSAIVTLSLIAAIAGKSHFKLSNGLGLIATATSLLLFAKVIEKLGSLNEDVLHQGGNALALLAGIVSGMAAIIGLTSKNASLFGGIGMFLELTAATLAVIAFAGVAALLGSIPENTLVQGEIALTTLAGLVVLMLKLVNIVSQETGLRKATAAFVELIGLTIALTTFAALAVVLGVLGIPAAIGMVIMGGLVVEIGLLMKAITLYVSPNFKDALKGVAAIALFGLALIPAVYVLKQLSELDYTSTVDGLKLLGNLLGAFAILLGVSIGVGLLASIAGPIILIGMGVVAGVLFAFVGAIAILVKELEKLAALDTNAAREGLECVREELEVLTDLAHQFMEEEGLFGASMEAALTCWAFGIGLNKLANDTRILGLANAAQASEALKVVQEEIDLMFELGEYLAQNEGSFAKGVNASAMALSFGIGLHGLANDTRILGLTNAENAKAAIEPMNGLIATMVMLANTIGTDPTMFGKAAAATADLVLFGIGLLPLVGAEYVAGLANAENVTANFKSLGSMIDTMFDLATKISDDASLYFSAKAAAEAVKEFGLALIPMMGAEFLGKFVNVEASTSAFEGAKNAINWLVTVASDFKEDTINQGAARAIDRLNGFAQALTRLNISNFLSQFVNADMAVSGLTPVKEIIDMLVSMAKDFASEEGIFDASEAAVEACGTFAGSLKKIVKAENRIAKADAEAAMEGLGPVQTIVSMLVDTAKEFATTEGMAEAATTASTSITTFANNLITIAKSFSKGEFADVDPTVIANIVSAITQGISELAGINDDIAAVAQALEGVGDIFSSLGSLTSSNGIFGASSIDISGITGAFTAIKESLVDLGNTAVQEDVGGKIISSLVDPIVNGSSTAVTAMLSLGEAMSGTITSFEQAFYVDGNNLAVGFINGINSQVQAAYDAGYNLASEAEHGTRDAGEISSPSKVFTELGGFLGEGFVDGIESKYSAVGDAAKGMAEQAIEIVSALNDRMQTLLAEKQNQLHISPVVDMEGITKLKDAVSNIQGSRNYGNYQVSGEVVDAGIRSKSVMPELKSLHEHLAQLGEHIDGLQIILDSGQLVGATSAKMDSQFGVMAMRRGRGN